MDDQNKRHVQLEEIPLLKKNIQEPEQTESEQIKTVEALRQSEERLRFALDATQEGLWEINLHTNKGFFSPRWCEIIGYSHNDPELPHTFDAWASRIHPDDYARVMSVRNNHIQHGTRYDVDYRHRHKSGEYRWQNTRGMAFFDRESGKPVKMIGCSSDIQARKQAELQLRESESRYQLLFDSSLDAISILGNNPPKLHHANPAFLQLFGYTIQELLAFSAADMFVVVHPDDQELVRNRLHRRFQGEDVPQLYEFRIVRKDGQVRWVEVSASLFSNNGQLLSQAIYRDITERKQTEEKLQAQEIRLRTILESTGDGILVVDNAGKLIMANQKAAQIWKIPPDLLHEDNEEVLLAYVCSQVVNKDQFLAKIHTLYASCNEDFDTILFKDGRTIERYSCPLLNEGVVDGRVWSFRDITERKHTEEKLRKSVENYKSLASTADSLFILDRNYIMIFANEHLLSRLSPHVAGPIIGESIDDIFHSSQTIHMRKGVDEVFSTGKHYYDEIWGYYAETYYVRTFSPVFDENGNVTSVTIVSKNMTKQKIAEMDLKQSEEKYRALASTIDSVFLIDTERRYLFANDNYLASHPPKMGSIIGKKYDDLHNKEDSKRFTDAVKRVIITGKPYQDEHLGNAIARYWLRTFGPIRDGEGSITAVIISATDIHDRKLAEIKLLASLREKDLLLREIHHRVKNNMQVMSGLLSLQASSSGNPEISAMCHESQKRIHSMALIHEKLYRSGDFTKIDLADYAMELAKELISSYTSDPARIALIMEGNGAHTDINKAIPCGLILNELITNVLKHAFPENGAGELRIGITETENSETQIIVRDNGRGLPKDVNPHQPQGIGLYLVNGLVINQLVGQLEVVQDKGTVFKIMFPS